MYDSDNDSDELLFYKIVKDYFGKTIADHIKDETSIIYSQEVSYLSARFTHPCIQPTYNALIKEHLPVSAWVIIFNYIINCQSIPKHKLREAYKAIYETLTGGKFNINSFELLPKEDKTIWETYTEKLENYNTKQGQAKHLKECLRLTEELNRYCKEHNIKVPELLSEKFLEDLDFDELSKRHQPATDPRLGKKRIYPDLNEKFERLSLND